jgi:hypothetical protein
VVVAESAWLTVVYAAIETAVAHEGLRLDLWAFAAAAVVGRLVTARWGAAALGLAALVAALVGWVLGPGVVEALAGPDKLLALLHHPGGWLLAVAAWRGGRGIGTDVSDASSLMTGGLLILAIPWLIGAGGPRADEFTAAALPATLVFAGAGLLAIGLARLRQLSAAVGTDWRDNASWVGLLAGVVVLLLVVGVPAGLVLGASLGDMVRTVLGPIAAVSDAATEVLGPVFQGERHQPVVPVLGGDDSSGLTGWVFGIGALMMAVIVVILVLAVVRAPRLRREVEPRHRLEEHFFVLPRLSMGIRRPKLAGFARRRRRPAPRTASEAYLVTLADLGEREETARRPGESPLQHARRLRDRGLAPSSFVLLAADYALERYGGAPVSGAERRRALRRASLIGR